MDNLKLLEYRPQIEFEHFACQKNPLLEAERFSDINSYSEEKRKEIIHDTSLMALSVVNKIIQGQKNIVKTFEKAKDSYYDSLIIKQLNKEQLDIVRQSIFTQKEKNKSFIFGEYDIFEAMNLSQLSELSWPACWEDSFVNKIGGLVFYVNNILEGITGIKGALGLNGKISIRFKIMETRNFAGVMRTTVKGNKATYILDINADFFLGDSGANLLATIYHEWFHAFDRYLRDQFKSSCSYVRYFSELDKNSVVEDKHDFYDKFQELKSQLMPGNRKRPPDIEKWWDLFIGTEKNKSWEDDNVLLAYKLLSENHDFSIIYHAHIIGCKDNSAFTQIYWYCYTKFVYYYDYLIKRKTKAHPFDITYRMISQDKTLHQALKTYDLFSPCEIFARWFEQACLSLDDRFRDRTTFLFYPVMKGVELNETIKTWRELMKLL